MTVASLPDLLVLAGYLLLTLWAGRKLGGSAGNAREYFTTQGSIPWWASSLSIVATETSLLTVLSTPAVAYSGSLGFLQLALGYIAGRFLVARWLLPVYFEHSPESTYTYLGHRFGSGFRKLVSSTFIVTRILADGVRLFAASIPLHIFLGLPIWQCIVILCAATLLYTYTGGLKSVIWVDVIQWATFLLCGLLLAGYLIFNGADFSVPASKFQVFHWPETFGALYSGVYLFPVAFIGGAVLSMASHGTDHIIVQRVLACKNLADGQKALIWSGFIVFLQFALFLGCGVLLFDYYGGKNPADLGLDRGDELVMFFVNTHFHPGIRGFFIAGLIAAALSTLSSSLSALSSSTFFDLFPGLAARKNPLLISRLLMVFWCVLFTVFASSFQSSTGPVIEIGLSIAGFTYGALLGSVLSGRLLSITPAVSTVAFISTIAGMFALVRYSGLAWPWFTLCGVLIYLSSAGLVHGISRFTLRYELVE